MSAKRSLSPAAAAIKRHTYDRIHGALPIGGDVTPREAWRLAGAIGAATSVDKVLRGLEAEGRVARVGRLPDVGNRLGANLWRRIE